MDLDLGLKTDSKGIGKKEVDWYWILGHHFKGIGYYFFSDGFWILNGQGVTLPIQSTSDTKIGWVLSLYKSEFTLF